MCDFETTVYKDLDDTYEELKLSLYKWFTNSGTNLDDTYEELKRYFNCKGVSVFWI